MTALCFPARPKHLVNIRVNSYVPQIGQRSGTWNKISARVLPPKLQMTQACSFFLLPLPSNDNTHCSSSASFIYHLPPLDLAFQVLAALSFLLILPPLLSCCTLCRSLECALGRSWASLSLFSYHALSLAAQRHAGSTLQAVLWWSRALVGCWHEGVCKPLSTGAA